MLAYQKLISHIEPGWDPLPNDSCPTPWGPTRGFAFVSTGEAEELKKDGWDPQGLR